MTFVAPPPSLRAHTQDVRYTRREHATFITFGLVPPFAARCPALTMSLYNYNGLLQEECLSHLLLTLGPKLSAVDVASCNSQVESIEKKEKAKVT